jgi:polyhydroxybutyrate depolymerase
LPLIIALHGNGDQATNFIQTSQLIARTDAVVVAPQGIARPVSFMGTSVGTVSWDPYNSVATGNIDLPLLEKLRTDLLASGSIDANKVSVFGYSQGGYLSYRYAAEFSSNLSCAAVVGASESGGAPTPFTRKLPFIFQVGSNDQAAGQARTTANRLKNSGHEVQFNEIAGAGHSPFPGSRTAPADFCLSKQL